MVFLSSGVPGSLPQYGVLSLLSKAMFEISITISFILFGFTDSYSPVSHFGYEESAGTKLSESLGKPLPYVLSICSDNNEQEIKQANRIL